MHSGDSLTTWRKSINIIFWTSSDQKTVLEVSHEVRDVNLEFSKISILSSRYTNPTLELFEIPALLSNNEIRVCSSSNNYVSDFF